ncbi:MAG: cytidylate kinase-like family protein [Deltaproteobacteria bacterium]|nr:MAG: cytidylate kinase-like family protein [Deltaproteobacteria bacterium]
MPIITISRGSFTKGIEVSEKVADRLGYECLSRDVILEASKEFNVPEIKLIRAIHDAPSILDRFGYRKEKYIAYVESAILRHLRKDNTVYCGLAGHFFVKDVKHALKVRIIADLEERVRNEMEREGISYDEALRVIKKDDEERRKWSLYLYGIDTKDPSLYDIVINIKKMTVDDAVDIICHTVSLETFQTTPQSQKHIEDLATAAEVKAAIVNIKPDVQVVCKDGVVQVRTRSPLSEEEAITKEIREAAMKIEGVNDVRVNVKLTDPVD